jgi:hypothetical protein
MESRRGNEQQRDSNAGHEIEVRVLNFLPLNGNWLPGDFSNNLKKATIDYFKKFDLINFLHFLEKSGPDSEMTATLRVNSFFIVFYFLLQMFYCWLSFY